MHIAICTPAYQHIVHVDYMSSVLSTFVHYMQQKEGHMLTHHVVSNIASASKNRNALASAALAAEADVMVMIDSDIGFHPTAVEFCVERLSEDTPLIAALPQVNVLIDGKKAFGVNMIEGREEHRIVDGLMEVRDVPTAFMCIHLPTLKKLQEMHPDKRYEAHGVEGSGEHLYALFDYLLLDVPGRPGNRTYTGEDYGFCHYWREAGFPIYAAPSIPLRHVKTMKLDGKWMDELQEHVKQPEGSEHDAADARLDSEPVGTGEPEPKPD